MITHRGFSAWISSEGQSLRSYEPTLDSRENKVSCWIPSSEGKVREHDTSRLDLCKQSSRTSLSIGGITEVELTRQLIYTSMGLSSRDTSYTVQATPREAGCDQAQYMSDHSSSQGLEEEVGSIILKIKRVKRKGLHPPNAPQPPPDVPRLGNRRRLDHCVSYGHSKETRNQVQSTWALEPYDPANPRSYVTFVFRYRPAEFLVDQGIMSAAELRNMNRIQQDTPPVTPGQALFSLPDSLQTPQEGFSHYQNFFVPQWDPSLGNSYFPANGLPTGNFPDSSFQAGGYSTGDFYTGNFSAASSSVGTFSAAGSSVGTFPAAGPSVGTYSGGGPSVGTYSEVGTPVGTYSAAGSSMGTYSAAGSSVGTFSAASSSVGTYSAGTFSAGAMSYQGQGLNYNNSTYSFS